MSRWLQAAARTCASAGIAWVAMLLGGCNVELLREHPLGCRADERALVRDTLYFGLSIAGGEVGAGDWQRFADEIITPAFPQGYSLIEAHGEWRGADGRTGAEPSRIVVIVHADDAASAAGVREIARRYRERFQQEAVLRERSAVCAAL